MQTFMVFCTVPVLKVSIILLISCTVVGVGLYFFLTRTTTGRKLRDKVFTALLGTSHARHIFGVVVLGMALCGLDSVQQETLKQEALKLKAKKEDKKKLK